MKSEKIKINSEIKIVGALPNCNTNVTVSNPKPDEQEERKGGFKGYGKLFENDLLNDIIPYIESHYSVYTDRKNDVRSQGCQWAEDNL